MVDAHVHINQFVDPARALRELSDAGAYVFAQTTDPREPYEVAGSVRASRLLRGLGYHPWWVAKDAQAGELSAGLELMVKQMPAYRLIGEVGLDFSRKYVETKDTQIEAFSAIVHEAMRLSRETGERRILSVHSIRAGQEILKILKSSGAPDVLVICMHWFGGTSEEMHELKELGAYFSWGEEALKVGKCREYAKLPDNEHMLLETDYPWRDDASSGRLGHSAQMEAHAAALRSALACIAELRAVDADELLHTMETNMRKIIDNDL